MSKEEVESREFIRGAARLRDLVYLISRSKQLVSEDIAHTSLIANYRGRWAKATNTAWNSTAIAVARLPEEKAILVGEEGDVVTYVGGTTREETISPEPVQVRNAREIAGYVYACGMKRQAYWRAGENQWLDISAPSSAGPGARGFEAIDGFAQDEVYAVGWSGEIWQFDGDKWHERTSPTNVILTAVCCAGDGHVYAAGQGGVLLAGRNDGWAVVELGEDVTADFWDLCWYQDRLYVATMTALYILDQDVLVPVDFGGIMPGTFYSLSTAEGALWSVGLHDVITFDGSQWKTFT